MISYGGTLNQIIKNHKKTITNLRTQKIFIFEPRRPLCWSKPKIV
jgi:hypothetical protein